MRAVASVTEAMLVSMIAAVLAALAFTFFAGYYDALTPDIKREAVDAVLCGKHLAVKNTGETTVEINGAWGIYYVVDMATGGIRVESDKLAITATLRPGETWFARLEKPYTYIILDTGDGPQGRPVHNSCIEEYTEET